MATANGNGTGRASAKGGRVITSKQTSNTGSPDDSFTCSEASIRPAAKLASKADRLVDAARAWLAMPQ